LESYSNALAHIELNQSPSDAGVGSAHNPDTATRIATQLAIRVVSDTPPGSLVSRLASV
jgi:hypothetical protein